MSMSFAKWLKGHVDCIKTIPPLTHKIAKDSVSDKEDFDTWLGAFDAETDPSKKQHWITTSNGQHVLIDGEGNVQAGMGGKFNGQKITEAHTNGAKKTAAKKPSSESRLPDLTKEPGFESVVQRGWNEYTPEEQKWLTKHADAIKKIRAQGNALRKQYNDGKISRTKRIEEQARLDDKEYLLRATMRDFHSTGEMEELPSWAKKPSTVGNAQKPSANTRANGKPLDGLEGVYEKYGESINKQYNKWKAELDAKGVKLTDKEEDLLEDFARHAGGMKQDLDKLWDEQREAIKSRDRKLFDSYEDMRHGLEDSLARVTNRANDFIRKKLFGDNAQKPSAQNDLKDRYNVLKKSSLVMKELDDAIAKGTPLPSKEMNDFLFAGFDLNNAKRDLNASGGGETAEFARGRQRLLNERNNSTGEARQYWSERLSDFDAEARQGAGTGKGYKNEVLSAAQKKYDAAKSALKRALGTQKPADVRSRANSLKEKLSKIPDLSFSRAKDLIKQLDSAESFPNEQRTRHLERLLDGYEKLNEGHNKARKEMMAKGSSAKEWEKRAFEQDSQKLRDLTDQISKQAATLSLEMNKAPKRN